MIFTIFHRFLLEKKHIFLDEIHDLKIQADFPKSCMRYKQTNNFYILSCKSNIFFFPPSPLFKCRIWRTLHMDAICLNYLESNYFIDKLIAINFISNYEDNVLITENKFISSQRKQMTLVNKPQCVYYVYLFKFLSSTSLFPATNILRKRQSIYLPFHSQIIPMIIAQTTERKVLQYITFLLITKLLML